MHATLVGHTSRQHRERDPGWEGTLASLPAVPPLEVGDPAFPELGDRVPPTPLLQTSVIRGMDSWTEDSGSAGGSPGRALPTLLSAWGMALPDHSHLQSFKQDGSQSQSNPSLESHP